MKADRFFGTDGIRGLYGQHPLTPQGIWSLGYALGRWILDQGGGNPFVFIGKDTRASCNAIEQALSGGLNACGIGVISIGCAPTPSVSFLTRAHSASAGLMISASHNPAVYNGVKLFNRLGEKLSIDQEQLIASYISEDHRDENHHHSTSISMPSGTDYLKEYAHFLIQNTPELPPLRIVVDCAHGAYSTIAAHILQEKGADVVAVLGASPDGHNINAGCGSVYPQYLAGAVVHHGADVGISFDGDGDRVILVTADGKIQDGDQILALLAERCEHKVLVRPGHDSRYGDGRTIAQETVDLEHLASAASRTVRPGSSGVVGTVLSNLGLERFLQSKNIPFARTHVGDRWIAQKLKELGWTLGGESCGHIILADSLPTGDGLLAGLHALHHIGTYIHHHGHGAEKDRGLFPIFHPTPSALVNVTLRVPQFYQHPKFLEYYQNIQDQMGQDQRVLLRPSGTEPVLRILVEGESQEFVSLLAQTIANDLDEQQYALEGNHAL
ncbi:MAG: phosphoglucosamine mutase [Alphaproteobacteria bacterium]|nr:phosphoglucosamine mutase [Alphaproteobacteria bacterium]